MYLGVFQLIALGLMVLGLGITLSQHGKPKEGKHSFWVTLVSQAIWFLILYFGGFFGK